MKKDDLLNLIDYDLDSAFIQLDTFFLSNNTTYLELNKEYIDQPIGFSSERFRSRLKRFVSINYNETKSSKPYHSKEVDFFKLLCGVNYEHQMRNFNNNYNNRNVSAFLLYGENAEQRNDVKWCYHQLLHSIGLASEIPICIDFSANSNNGFEELLNVLYARFRIEANLQILRDAIQSYLMANHLVVIIKYPKELLDLKAFYNSFHGFLCYLTKEVISKNNCSLIFIIIEHDLDKYHALSNQYFFWYKKKYGLEYSKKVKESKEVKIIDLSPIEKTNEKMIKKWIADNLNIEQIHNNLSCYLSNVDESLFEANNPFNVIRRFYLELKINSHKNIEEWLIH